MDPVVWAIQIQL